jgi:glycosyltransferase involved in cell wall biosynthesis
MILSVVICTHNPRRDYLDRVLAALQSQTLPREQWELVVVDNVSNPPLASTLDLSWHAQSRIILEPELGNLPARVRGLKESRTPFILFVDDDNVLVPDYLEKALAIAETHPFLGVWGGSIRPEFEVPPPPWIDEVRWLLACVEITEDYWSNLKFNPVTMPPTAGMCLRRAVAEAFIRLVQEDPRRQLLGRRGKSGLTGSEDTDLAITACDMGFGIGRFAALKMTHLIPAYRLDEDYLIRFAEAAHFSAMVLGAMRGQPPAPYRPPTLRSRLGSLRRRLFWDRRRRAFFEGEQRAHRRACEAVAAWK